MIFDGYQTVFGKTSLPRRKLVSLLFAAPLTPIGVEQLLRKLELSGEKGVGERPMKMLTFLSMVFGPNSRLNDARKGSSVLSTLEDKFHELAKTRMDLAVDGPANVSDCISLGLCSVSAHATDVVTQKFALCKDCNARVCVVCSSFCHKDHNLVQEEDKSKGACGCGLYRSLVSCTKVDNPPWYLHSTFKSLPASAAQWFELPVSSWPVHISFVPLVKVEHTNIFFSFLSVFVFLTHFSFFSFSYTF